MNGKMAEEYRHFNEISVNYLVQVYVKESYDSLKESKDDRIVRRRYWRIIRKGLEWDPINSKHFQCPMGCIH